MAESAKPFPESLIINYLKANDYREIACDGALGGPTPDGSLIWIALYSERNAFPRIVEVPVVRDGQSQEFTLDESHPKVIEGRDGLIRNLEVGAYLSIQAAERLHAWLGTNLANLKRVQAK